jgi:hypothetical protein
MQYAPSARTVFRDSKPGSFAYRQGAWQNANAKRPDALKTSKLLRGLICACVDDQWTLQHERAFVDARAAETLTRLALERAQFVKDLERLGEPAQSRRTVSWAEFFREVGRNVWVTAAGPNNGDAIATCRRSRARTETRYDGAMRGPLPDEIRSVLAVQRSRLQDEADELNRLQF